MTTATSTMSGRMARPSKQPSPKTWSGRIARRLKELRIAAGLDVAGAAQAISAKGYRVGSQAIYKWEQGSSLPLLDAFPAIASAYGVKAHELLPPR